MHTHIHTHTHAGTHIHNTHAEPLTLVTKSSFSCTSRFSSHKHSIFALKVCCADARDFRIESKASSVSYKKNNYFILLNLNHNKLNSTTVTFNKLNKTTEYNSYTKNNKEPYFLLPWLNRLNLVNKSRANLYFQKKCKKYYATQLLQLHIQHIYTSFEQACELHEKQLLFNQLRIYLKNVSWLWSNTHKHLPRVSLTAFKNQLKIALHCVAYTALGHVTYPTRMILHSVNDLGAVH